MERIKYRCPGCGKKVKFGTHFCSGEPEARLDDPFPERRSSPRVKFLRRAGIILVASAVLIVLLLSTIGVFAFLLIPLAALIIGAMALAGKGENSGKSGLRKLRNLTGGDAEAAERLIEAEMQRYPDFTRAECIRRVSDRLVYERSR